MSRCSACSILLVVVSLVVIMCPARVSGQGGAITLYWDEPGTWCHNFSYVTGSVDLYVFHRFTPGMISAKYRIQNCGTDLVWVADHNYSNQAVGTSVTGIAIEYGQCAQDYLVQRVTFSGMSSPPNCSGFLVVPHPDEDTILGTSCLPEVHPADGAGARFDYDGFCGSGFYCLPAYCNTPVPVESTTWGKVKELYE